jgi:hypothetical protein
VVADEGVGGALQAEQFAVRVAGFGDAAGEQKQPVSGANWSTHASAWRSRPAPVGPPGAQRRVVLDEVGVTAHQTLPGMHEFSFITV